MVMSQRGRVDMCPRKAISNTFTSILQSESTNFLALSTKNHPANHTTLSDQNHIIPQNSDQPFFMVWMLQSCNSFLKEVSILLLLQ